MKKILKRLMVSALVLASSISLVACVNDPVDTSSNIGDKLPSNINPKYSINKNMSALEMYEVGVKNYNEMDYVASVQKGNIVSSAVGMKVKQTLDSTKIKQDGKYYLDTYVITQNPTLLTRVDMMDQSVYEDGKYRVRSAGNSEISVKSDENGVKYGEVNKWKTIDYFNSLEAGLDKYPNDPTRLSMYIVNNSTVTNQTKPVYDAKTNQYTFSLTLDCDKATVDYIENMYYNIKKNSATENGVITFTSLKLNVVMWDNGLIKSITTNESYEIAKAIGNPKTTNIYTTYVTYDPKELKINDYIKF